MPRKPPPNKHFWTREEISFLKKNFLSMTNRQLATALGLTLTLVRTRCYLMGLKRMELEYWTSEQIRYLRNYYQKCGDLELAERFQRKWPKKKGWTLKHIEKKRMYLGLKRTKKELRSIKDKAIRKGVYVEGLKKTWEKRGMAKDGDVRYWKQWRSMRDFPVIKVKGVWKHWGPYMYKKHIGRIPAGHKVTFKDGNNRNLSIGNLELITDAEMSIRNSLKSSQGLSDNYITGMLTRGRPMLRQAIRRNKDLIDLKRQQLILNRTINGKRKEGTADQGNA
jgi:hypothetical protein